MKHLTTGFHVMGCLVVLLGSACDAVSRGRSDDLTISVGADAQRNLELASPIRVPAPAVDFAALTVGEDGFRLAEGSVNDYEGREIHVGDPASVKLFGDPDSAVHGTVEWVRRPKKGPQGHTAVGVRFSHVQNVEHDGTAALVIVTPSGAGDSVLAVPRAALVRLSLGFAVMVPLQDGEVEVRFVSIGPFENDHVIVRNGLEEARAIVIGGWGRLRLAAEDSLKQRALRNSRIRPGG